MMLEEKEAKIFKEKAKREFNMLAQRMDQQQDIPKNDWDKLYLLLKIAHYICDVEKGSQQEQEGYSGYSNRGSYGSYDGYSGYRGRGANGQFVSRDGYAGNGSYAGGGSYANDGYAGANSYDNQVLEEMMRHASPQEREVLMRMRNKMQQQQ